MTRTTTLLATLPGLLLLGACAATTPPASISGCQSQVKSTACPAAPPVVNINLNKAGGSMANPECVTAHRGSLVRLNITPKRDNGSVVTVPADAANGWLLSSNTNPADKTEVLIQVPADIEFPVGTEKREYKYLVLADDGACLDPRMVIDKN